MSNRRIKSIDDICVEDYYSIFTQSEYVNRFNGIICEECDGKSKQCHFGKLFQTMNKQNELIYDGNKFQLSDFPFISTDQINGIVGKHGMGKTILLNILGNKIKPKQEYLHNNPLYRSYVKMLKTFKPKIVFKEQELKSFKSCKLVINYILKKKISKITLVHYDNLDIIELLHKELNTLNKNEIQLLRLWCACVTDGDIYIFDEPFNYLDISQKIKVAISIKRLFDQGKVIILSDNDMVFMDYICDNLIVINGKSNSYGIISNTESLKKIKDNFLPQIHNNLSETCSVPNKNKILFYPETTSSDIIIKSGIFNLNGSINVLVGPTQSGKTFFLYWLKTFQNYSFSVKDENLKCPWFTGNTVLDLLRKKLGSRTSSMPFVNNVIKPLNIRKLFNVRLVDLSIEEKHLIEIIICLGMRADIYLIDGISQHLDYKTRVLVASVIRDYIIKRKKMAFIIDNDFMVLSTVTKQIESSIIMTEIDNSVIVISSPSAVKKTMKRLFNMEYCNSNCERPFIK